MNSVLNRTIKKLAALAQEIAKDRGDWDLFGFFLREDSGSYWDLVVSAAWAEKDKRRATEYLADALVKCLTKRELLQLDAIAIIERDRPDIKKLRKRIKGRLPVELANFEAFDMAMQHAYLIAGKPYQAKEKQPIAR